MTMPKGLFTCDDDGGRPGATQWRRGCGARRGARAGASGFLAYRRRVPGKKKAGKALQVLPPLGGRVSVHMMASIHDSAELVDTLRARFPSGVVQRESPYAAL